MLKILKQPKGQLEVKRFYLEEAEILYTCPNCGAIHGWNDYLGYPNINEFMVLTFWCNECSCEWTEELKINLSIESR